MFGKGLESFGADRLNPRRLTPASHLTPIASSNWEQAWR
jgi:hypothetical protein